MIKELRILKELEELTGEGSQKKKQEIIKQNWTSELAYVFDVCFNPFVTTKLHKLNFSEDPSDSFGLDNFKELVEKLKSAPAANNSIRLEANQMVNTRITDDSDDADLRKILMKVLTKRMNVGVGAKLINKAIGREVIPDPSVMLATDDQDSLLNWDKIYCEEKYDGVRVIAIYKEGGFSYFTRAFNELDADKLHKITFSLKQIMNFSGLKGSWFFDGELTDHNRKSVSGKVTQILKGTAPDNIGDSIIFNVFDLEEYDTLRAGVGIIPYSVRRQTLESVMKNVEENEPVKLATMWELEDPSQIASIYQKIVDAGGEGVICKKDSVYQCSRSKNWIKFKEVNDCDLEIIGWYPGEGKREGYIGGFMCSSSCRKLNVNVGSGFTDAFIKSIRGNEDSYIGKILKVEYNVRITDKNDSESLFLPRMKEVRPDKFIANSINEIR